MRVRVRVVADDRLMAQQLMDIHGVAERLGVSERHVRRLVFERRIPFIKWATSFGSTRTRSIGGSTAHG